MRKILLLVVIISSIASCKKGENDPFLSLLTRKQRITGDWKVTYAKYTVNDTIWEYNGTELIKTYNNIELEKLAINYLFKFEKTGDYSIDRDTEYPADFFAPNTPPIKTNYLEAGIWNFTGGAGDTKTKSQLLTQPTRIERRIEGLAEVDAEVAENPIYGKVVNLDMLKSKEMRWTYDYTNSTATNTVTETGTWEFEKQ